MMIRVNIFYPNEESILLYREMGHRKALAESLAILEQVRAAEGEQSAALSLYEESLAIARELNHSALIRPLPGRKRTGSFDAGEVLVGSPSSRGGRVSA